MWGADMGYCTYSSQECKQMLSREEPERVKRDKNVQTEGEVEGGIKKKGVGSSRGQTDLISTGNR